MGEVVTKDVFNRACEDSNRLVKDIYPQRIELEKKLKNEKDRNRKEDIKRSLNDIKKNQDRIYKSIVNNTLEAWRHKKISEISDYELAKFMSPEGIAEAIACSLDFKTTQLRRSFQQLRFLQYDAKQDELKLYKVKKVIALLAYSAGRDLIDEDFFKFSKSLLEKVKDKDDLDIVVELLEAIVAYRKYYES